MDSLSKLFTHLIDEADHLASRALHSKEPKHIDIVLKYCDAAHGIKEILEFHEDYSESKWKDDMHDEHEYEGNPVRRRRRR